MSPSNELHAAVESLLESLNRELVDTIRERDMTGAHRERLAGRAIDLETRISEVAELEKRVRKMP